MRRIVVLALAVCCLSLMSSREVQGRTTVASWYGPGFAGNPTANGEIYRPNQATAAHKRLPFGTPVKICLRGCARVTVNDRGPYANGAEFDLSRGAARTIGLIHPGVAPVRVNVYNAARYRANRYGGGYGGAGQRAGGDAGGFAGAGRYTVQRGDTLAVISRRLGVSVGRLAAVNEITDPDLIYAGQVIRY